MGMMYAAKPIVEPYSEEVRLELAEAWEKEKQRLMEADVTISKNVEPLVRRVFFAGYVAAMNVPVF
jgi:hypothetical protein